MSEIMRFEKPDNYPLPCPFCGCSEIIAERYEHTAGTRYRIMCCNCTASIDPGWAQTLGTVLNMWNRRDGYIPKPDDYSHTNNLTIKGVTFMLAKDKNFTYEAYRADCGNKPIAWVAYTTKGVELYTAVSIEHYKTLAEAAEAIAKYK